MLQEFGRVCYSWKRAKSLAKSRMRLKVLVYVQLPLGSMMNNEGDAGLKCQRCYLAVASKNRQVSRELTHEFQFLLRLFFPYSDFQ